MPIITGFYKVGYCGLKTAQKVTRKAANVSGNSLIRRPLLFLEDEIGFAKDWVRYHIEPTRLSPQQATERFVHYLENINREFPLFKVALEKGIPVLEAGKVADFTASHLKQIEKRAEVLTDLQKKASRIQYFLGFNRPHEKQEIDVFLSEISHDFKADKALLQFKPPAGLVFYFWGFSPSEQLRYLDLINDADEIILKRLHLASSLDAYYLDTLTPEKQKQVWEEPNFYNPRIYLYKRSGNFPEADQKKLRDLLNKESGALKALSQLLESFSRPALQMTLAKHHSAVDDIKLGYSEHIKCFSRSIREGEIDLALGRLKAIVSWLPGSINKTTTWLEVYRNGTEYKEVNLVPLLAEVISPYLPVTKSKGLQFEFSPDAGTANCLVDPNLFKMVLTNLLDNAVKYTPAGKITVKATEEWFEVFPGGPRSKEIAIEVQDTGIGIPKEERAEIFARYYRASNVGDIGGTGIGLDFVRKAVRGMGGDVKVYSQEGKGATFSVYFPLID